MRILFVSGTTTGGSASSTRELAWALAERGHDVGLLARGPARPRAGLVAPTRDGPVHELVGLPARAWRRVRRAVASEPRAPLASHGVMVWTSPAPERALPAVCRAFGPQVVVVNSVPRNPWRSIRSWLERAGLPSVLYVREAATLEQLPIAATSPTLVLANSRSLQTDAARRGVEAQYVPSVVDFDRYAVETSRETVLFVNPIATRGLAIAAAIARDDPEHRFAFQLSWPLRRRDLRALHNTVADLPNVELRDHEPEPGRIYRDARVLLVPYLVDQRPRAVAEAQSNGIPVLASDLAGHREAVGPGGRFVPIDAPPARWSSELGSLLDAATYRRLSAAARVHARRADQDREQIVSTFEQMMREIVSTAALR